MNLQTITDYSFMWHNIFSDMVAVFFPRFCVACDTPLLRNEQLLCTSCMITIPRIGMDPHMTRKLEERLHGEAAFTYVMAFVKFYKSGITQRLLHHMKYRDRPDLARLAGRWFGGEIAARHAGGTFDLIAPVPLHRKKERRRGYNQSAYLAIGIGESTGIPVRQVLLRTKNSDTQTHKSRIERWNNVSGIFRIADPALVSNKHVLLVDDVVTTGATLESCGCTLLQGGAKQVSAAALAMAM